MKTTRKALSNKIRFEVFRRDSFTCQYCGRSAPDIILNADHINPVSKGGKDDIFNLITSCFECNSGKRAKKLSSETEISKQKKQLDLLNERRVQLDMLLQWKTGLLQNIDDQAARIGKYLVEKTGDVSWSLSDNGLLKFKIYLKKLPASRLIEIIDETVDQLSSSISYYGITDKTYEIIFTVIQAKYMAETADHNSKMKYLLKQLKYRISLCDDDWTLITNILDTYLIKHNSVSDYIELQKMSKNDSPQEFYDKLHCK